MKTTVFKELTQYIGELNGTNDYRKFCDALIGMAEEVYVLGTTTLI